mgnify:CR=1 FL=1|tara:strand:+ start:213 stop:1259 length:1047 start_codon:yes stop_codon:yes gene_type:complete
MAILYNFKKEKDIFIIEAEQDTVSTLYYLSSGDEVEVSASTLTQNIATNIDVKKDGEYKILLEVEGEASITVYFTAFKELQDSIIENAKEILCGDCIECNGKRNKECQKAQNFFVKGLSFENLFVPSYGSDYPLIFSSFLSTSVKTITCKIQTRLNTILAEELVRGRACPKKVSNISDLYTALYWAAMYFIEEDIAGEDDEQLDFIKDKFHYDSIIECLCELCIDINTLKENYAQDIVASEIISFQFDGTEFDINDSDLLTSSWLEINGVLESQDLLLSGKNIINSLLGRVGFVVTNTQDKYRFFDALGNDITDTVFDNVWEEVSKRQIYISKEYYTPSTIYYKFIKT